MKKVLGTLLTTLQFFTLEAVITWDAFPTQISSTGVDASEPSIAIDLSGNSVAVWIENGFIQTSNLPFGGSWTTAQTLSSSGATFPNLIVDPNGNATAVWLESGIVKTSSQPFGGSWSGATSISSSGASSPHAAIDDTGNVVAVWARGGYIESSTLLFGGSWSVSPDVISDRISDVPHVAIGNDGTVTAVWHTVITSIDTIQSVQKPIGGVWGSPVSISSSILNSVSPKVAVDASGNAFAIWFKYNLLGNAYSNVIVQIAYQPSGGSWTTPVDVSAEGRYNPALLVNNIAIDGNGIATASWSISNDGSTFNLEQAVIPKNDSWKAIELIDLNLYAYSVNTKVDTQGHSQSIYMAYNSDLGSIDISAVEIDIYAEVLGETSIATLSQGTQNAFPKITTICSSDTIYSAGIWISNDGSNNVIHASSGTGLIFAPPTDLAVSQGSNDFNVFTEYFNTVTWTASTNLDTTNYLIYRNGVLINRVDASTFSYVDDNQILNGSVTYGVAAADNSFGQSAVATVNFP